MEESMTDEALEQHERDQDNFLRRVRRLTKTNDDHEREAMAAISDLAACQQIMATVMKVMVASAMTAAVLAVGILLLAIVHFSHGH